MELGSSSDTCYYCGAVDIVNINYITTTHLYSIKEELCNQSGTQSSLEKVYFYVFNAKEKVSTSSTEQLEPNYNKHCASQVEKVCWAVYDSPQCQITKKIYNKLHY